MLYIRLFLSALCFCISLSSVAQIANFRGHVQVPRGDISNFSVAGWACRYTLDDSVSVRMFAGETRQNATLIQTIAANMRTEEAVRERCNSEGFHRFKFDVDQKIVYEHSGQNLYFEMFLANEQSPLTGTAQYQLPVHPETQVKGFVDGIKRANNSQFLMGWACQTNVSEAIDVTAFVKDSGSIVILDDVAITPAVAESAVSNACETDIGRHRFRIRISDDVLLEHAGKPIHVIAKAAFGQQTRFLENSGKLLVPSIPSSSSTEKAPNVIVFFTDDQGFADLGVQGVADDIKTPNIDKLANNGIRFTNGYITAPQCSPSRAGMLSGRYQQRFGLDANNHIPMTLEQQTIADRFKVHDYSTGMFGKWHLEVMANSSEWGGNNFPDIQPWRVSEVPLEVRHNYFPHQRGFDSMLAGYTGVYLRNMDMRGDEVPVETFGSKKFRVELATEASLSFIDKNWQQPFFMYVSHYAPHVPLEASQKYLDRFPEDMPERRRYALAMMAALDDGVGDIVDKLENYNILDNTLIFFISDNGAPLDDDMFDAPIADAREGWNGSLNTPFAGEKGMLTEGALRVPFIMHWPKQIPEGMVIDTPVSSLDAAYTALNAAQVDDLSNLDGQDLLPLAQGDSSSFDQRSLAWRFYFQRAIRKGDWKYMQVGIEREYLFDMTQVEPESINFIEQYPEIADELREEYWQWSSEMPRPEPLVEAPVPFLRRVDFYLPTSP